MKWFGAARRTLVFRVVTSVLFVACGDVARCESAVSNTVLMLAPRCLVISDFGADVALAYVWTLGYGSVADFQRAKKLTADGIVSRTTWATLLREWETLPSHDSSSAESPIGLGLTNRTNGWVSVGITNFTGTTVTIVRGLGSETLSVPLEGNYCESGEGGVLRYMLCQTLLHIGNEPITIPPNGYLVATGRLAFGASDARRNATMGVRGFLVIDGQKVVPIQGGGQPPSRREKSVVEGGAER